MGIRVAMFKLRYMVKDHYVSAVALVCHGYHDNGDVFRKLLRSVI